MDEQLKQTLIRMYQHIYDQCEAILIKGRYYEQLDYLTREYKNALDEDE